MNTATTPNPSHSPNPILSIYDLARQDAERLRRQAIDEFWRSADAVLARAGMTVFAQVERIARRLQARMARRAARLALPG